MNDDTIHLNNNITFPTLHPTQPTNVRAIDTRVEDRLKALEDRVAMLEQALKVAGIPTDSGDKT
jgi:hypothetical protein